MKNGFLIHHLGLGDHIICNGLTRELSNKFDTLLFPVKHHNLINVKAMFADLENINFIVVNDDYEMMREWNKYSSIFLPIRLGCFEKTNFILHNETFCKAFYRQAQIPYEFRWSKFYIPRNKINEEKLADFIHDGYYFVHDDHSRNFKIKNFYLDKKVYRPNHALGKKTETSIFDYRFIIEKSEQIHCMDSSFAAFIDHLPELSKKQKFLHRYVRENSHNPEYRNNWTIIT